MIHPFDDGNGRIARAICDLVLSRAGNSESLASEDKSDSGNTSKLRPYSLSAQIAIEKKQYYDILEKDGFGDGDITEWTLWFASCVEHAIQSAAGIVKSAVNKARFWNLHSDADFNERQRKMLNKLIDGFEGKLNTSKWAKICHCSQDTALKDIKSLISLGIMEETGEGGRSTNYRLSGDF